jgi:hypothetical protein
LGSKRSGLPHPLGGRIRNRRDELETGRRFFGLRSASEGGGASPAKILRCAIYARVSTKYKLEQEFKSLDAQYKAAKG